jgi:uridine kinase
MNLTGSYELILNKLIKEIDKLLLKQSNVFIAIDGMAASGKSTLAKKLVNHFNGEIIHLDDFFLQDFQRTKERLAEIGGNLDYERLLEEVFLPLKTNNEFSYNKYNCQTKTFTKKEFKKPSLLIFEGAYSLRDEFLNYYDLKILMLIDNELQLERIERRNKLMFESFKNIWIPKENEYIETFNLKEKVDIVINVN